ncbi:MAG: hypothetical protein ACR2JH_04000 [Solirubrobacteraceae bacterium]
MLSRGECADHVASSPHPQNQRTSGATKRQLGIDWWGSVGSDEDNSREGMCGPGVRRAAVRVCGEPRSGHGGLDPRLIEYRTRTHQVLWDRAVPRGQVLEERVSEATRDAADWREELRLGIRAYLRTLDDEPVFARVYLLEWPAVGAERDGGIDLEDAL